ncbi:MAG: flagellar basal body rod protein FlgC [Acidobacteriota bacterium]|nr:flagellar basal body rod protein FlgC [Acidobacteriota bacterium]
MNLFGVMGISASGLRAERTRAEVVASNMANAESTNTAEGGPYKRKEVIFQSQQAGSFQMQLAGATGGSADKVPGGVTVKAVVADNSQPILRYEPSHPDANADGYVAYPNINPVLEMTDLMSASRGYQINASAVQAAKQMIQQSLDILK